MERYVVSKEWAEKLMKAGWKKRVNWYWIPRTLGQETEHRLAMEETIHSYPAPLTDELLEVLPLGYVIGCFCKWDDKPPDFYCGEFRHHGRGDGWKNSHREQANSAPNALAAMVCYLTEQGIIKL